jgi:hypothetical protein
MKQLIRYALAAAVVAMLGCAESPAPTGLDGAAMGKGHGNYPTDVLAVVIDVKPEAIGENGGVIVKDQNPVAVALFPAEEFDVETVMPNTVGFAVTGLDEFVPLAPVHELMRPLAFTSHLKDLDDDGIVDYLVFHFDPTTLPLGIWETCLTGMTQDNTAFEGCETVEIRE